MIIQHQKYQNNTKRTTVTINHFKFLLGNQVENKIQTERLNGMQDMVGKKAKEGGKDKKKRRKKK